MDDHPRLLLCVLIVTYLAITLPNAFYRPLWHDELVTYNLASAPSVSQMLYEIRVIDLNPPLLYLFDFVTIRIPGAQMTDHLISLAARLPSLVGGLMASSGLFFVLRRKVRSLYAIAAVGLLWSTAFLPYAWEDRPYALLTGLLMLSVLVWERATNPKRRFFWVAAALCTGLAMIGSHFMAAFLLCAFLATEFVRGISRRRIDFPLCAAYMLPLAIPFYYYGKISGYHGIVFPVDSQPTLISVPVEYGVLLKNSPLIFGASLLLYLIKTLMPPAARRHATDGNRVSSGAITATRAELVLLAGISLEPAFAVVAIMLSHGAFYLRYGLPGCISIAILPTVFLYALFEECKAAALFIAVVSIAVAATWSFGELFPQQKFRPAYTLPADSVPAEYRSIEPNLPFVDASGLTFVEMNHREPVEFLHRTYYLTDSPSAIKYAHATLFEGEAEVVQVFHFQSNVEALKSFEAEHSKFLVLGTINYQEDWLLRKLIADGNTLRHLGTFSTTYKDKDLYEVTLSPPVK